MAAVFEKYKSLCVEGSLICLAQSHTAEPFFCYPVNAEVIGYEGCILYCFIQGYGETVFAANPESCADKHVYPLAKDFSDFIRLILACGTTNPIEQIIWMNKELFQQHMGQELCMQTMEQKTLLMTLSKELALSPMDNPFEYVKEIQMNFDSSNIKFRDEYYNILGLEKEF